MVKCDSKLCVTCTCFVSKSTVNVLLLADGFWYVSLHSITLYGLYKWFPCIKHTKYDTVLCAEFTQIVSVDWKLLTIFPGQVFLSKHVNLLATTCAELLVKNSNHDILRSKYPCIIAFQNALSAVFGEHVLIECL